jgi:hypothetical protein
MPAMIFAHTQYFLPQWRITHIQSFYTPCRCYVGREKQLSIWVEKLATNLFIILLEMAKPIAFTTAFLKSRRYESYIDTVTLQPIVLFEMYMKVDIKI